MLTIGQYLEALANPEGRIRSLGRIYPVRDTGGNPVFSVPGHGLADFEVIAADTHYTLRCPLRSDAEAAGRLRILGNKDKGLSCRFFTEWRLLEKELLVFDGIGNPVEIDILVRLTPKGQKVADFLQKAADGNRTEALLSALRSFGELVEWMHSVGRGGTSAHKLLVAQDGEVSVTGFSANDESSFIALALFFTAAMPDSFAELGLPFIRGVRTACPIAVRLCASASEYGFPELSQILAGDVAGAVRRLTGRTAEEISALGAKFSGLAGALQENENEKNGGYAWRPDDGEGIKCVRDGAGWRYVDRRNHPVIDTVWLSAAPFREGRAEVETLTGKGLIDKEGRAVLEPVYEELGWDEYWNIVSVMAEGRWSLLDREGVLLTERHYDWLGECSEGLILAQKEGKCGFIDVEGREVIPLIYDDATSFSEGCAFVTDDRNAGNESFFIDAKGNRL